MLARAPKRATGAAHDEYEEDDRRIEYADILAKRVIFSRAHAVLCASMLVAGVVEVLWIFHELHSSTGERHLPEHVVFTVLETYVTIGLVGEIVLRLILQRQDFCLKWSNIVDVAVAAVSVISSALFAAGLETPAEMLLGTIIITARIVFRLIRLISVSKGWRQHQIAADKSLDISMDSDAHLRLDWDRDVEGGGDAFSIDP